MYVWTVDDVLAIKPNSLASMGYQYFLSYGAPRARTPLRLARSSAMTHVQKDLLCIGYCYEKFSLSFRFELQI